MHIATTKSSAASRVAFMKWYLVSSVMIQCFLSGFKLFYEKPFLAPNHSPEFYSLTDMLYWLKDLHLCKKIFAFPFTSCHPKGCLWCPNCSLLHPMLESQQDLPNHSGLYKDPISAVQVKGMSSLDVTCMQMMYLVWLFYGHLMCSYMSHTHPVRAVFPHGQYRASMRSWLESCLKDSVWQHHSY